ncbi:MAG TPA: T9SS type A sorting domain-containing protein, partial [Bacteroidia bacterium]|nr:T9SS type A sorting domain-containing protein [Bacteroidia bacterium]
RSSIQTGSSTSAGEGFTISTDASDNVYVGGWFQDSISFDTYVFNYGHGVFLTKYDSIGNLQWAKCGASLGTNQGVASGVTTDSIGNSYLTGWFNGSIVFDSDTLVSITPNDLFVAKYNSSGNLIWAKSMGSNAIFYPTIGITLDRMENIYLTSCFTSQFIFGTDTLIASGAGANYFVAKCDSSGNALWARSATHTCGGSQSLSVAADASASIYISGTFGNTSCSMMVGSDTLVSLGLYNIFIAKYDSSGNALWAKSAGGTGYDKAFFITADTIGNVYATGTFSSASIAFGSSTITNTSGNSDGFLAKYDSSGNALWAKSIGGSNLISYCVASDKQNKIYVCGGSFQPTDTVVTFDTLTVYYPGGTIDPFFVAGYDSSGQILFAKILASGSDDQNAITVSASGSIYVTSDYYQVNPFIIGNDTLILNGEENVFVAKLSYSIHEGVSEINSMNGYVLYPNPFSNSLFVKTNDNVQTEVILYDILSRKLLQQTFMGSTTLNVEQLASGLYIYEVRNKKGILANGKVIKQ